MKKILSIILMAFISLTIKAQMFIGASANYQNTLNETADFERNSSFLGGSAEVGYYPCKYYGVSAKGGISKGKDGGVNETLYRVGLNNHINPLPNLSENINLELTAYAGYVNLVRKGSYTSSYNGYEFNFGVSAEYSIDSHNRIGVRPNYTITKIEETKKNENLIGLDITYRYIF